MIELVPAVRGALAATMLIYTGVLFAIAWWARGRIANSEDYLVAGRRLPFSLSTATLFATWFGAGTLLAVADEVRSLLPPLRDVFGGIFFVFFGLTIDPRGQAQTMTAYMVQIFLGDASNFGPEYYSSYAVAATLFVMTLTLTLIGHRVRLRFREEYE